MKKANLHYAVGREFKMTANGLRPNENPQVDKYTRFGVATITAIDHANGLVVFDFSGGEIRVVVPMGDLP